MKVTNISEGPRGLNTSAGAELLEPNETRDVEMSDAEHASSYRTGWFDMPKPTNKAAAEATQVQSGQSDENLAKAKEEAEAAAAAKEKAKADAIKAAEDDAKVKK
jgi:hypothetical protein